MPCLRKFAANVNTTFAEGIDNLIKAITLYVTFRGGGH